MLVPYGHFMFRGSATSLGRPRKPGMSNIFDPAGPLVLVLVILSVCALAPAPARAQAVYGSIFGTITDQSGAAVVWCEADSDIGSKTNQICDD